MYDAIRARVVKDREAIDKAIAAIEAQPGRSAELEQVLQDLRKLREDKADSLQPRA
jgi:hypothetical protein